MLDTMVLFRFLLVPTLLCSTALSTVIKKTLSFTWEEGAPDGQSRYLIYTNGAFPGPPLIFTEGDDAEVLSGPLTSTPLPVLLKSLVSHSLPRLRS